MNQNRVDEYRRNFMTTLGGVAAVAAVAPSRGIDCATLR